VVFIFFFYVTTVGYGLGNIGKLPADPAPWDTLGRAYWGAGPTVLIDIASVVALVARALAAQNGAARMLFALGRDGLLPHPLGRTMRRFGTPVTALTVLLAASIAVGLGFGLGFGPLPAFSLLSLVVTLCALGVYALAQFGLARYFCGWASSTRSGTGCCLSQRSRPSSTCLSRTCPRSRRTRLTWRYGSRSGGWW
jgi:amino acid transporter